MIGLYKVTVGIGCNEWVVKKLEANSLLVKMNLFWVVCWVVSCLGVSSVTPFVAAANVSSSRPAVVHIGAIFNIDSVLGKVAKITLEEAVKDVNADKTILHGTQLVLSMQNSNHSGFVGMVQGNLFYSILQFNADYSNSDLKKSTKNTFVL